MTPSPSLPASQPPPSGASGAGRVRLLGLDGLRAISILMVVVGHSMRTEGFPVGWRSPALETVAGTGVTIFFGLSGFLITWLLLQEESAQGRVRLGEFYFRRALRILPAAFTYLLVMGLATALGWLPLRMVDLVAPAAFCANLIPVQFWVGHFWSLSVEEQFYFVWPLTFLWLPRRARLGLALVWVVISPAWHHLNQKYFGAANLNWVRPDLRFAPLMAGCGLALLWCQVEVRDWVLSRLGKARALGWLVSLTVFTSQWWMPASLGGAGFLASLFLTNLGLMGLILLAVTGGSGPASRVLNWGPVVWLGKLSYSLYLWQQVFCYPDTGRWQERFPLNLGLTLLAGIASFYLIETPCLRWRDRHLPRWFPHRPSTRP
jgi:peptidoglycan/LPS O-acetylase OafA/YrhL